MNRFLRIVLIASALPSWGCGSALRAQALDDLFLKMPQQVCPVLSEYNRLELVDNQKNGKPMRTRNLLQAYSHMATLTHDYAHLVLSANSEKTLKLLPCTNGSHVILVVSTVLSDSIADSSLAFYTTDWQPLPAADLFSQPTSTDFRRISIDPGTNLLTVTTFYPLTLQTDGSDQPVILPETTTQYRWDGNKFIEGI